MMNILIVEHAEGRASGIDSSIAANLGRPRVWRPYLGENPPSLLNFQGLVIGGGPMGVYELDAHPFFKQELNLIEQAVTSIPVLGICLGAQLLAYVGGGEVQQTVWRRGWLPVELLPEGVSDPLFVDCERDFTTFQWHQDEVTRLPRDGIRLATSGNCSVEGFRLRARPVWGMQAHIEVTLEKAAQIYASVRQEISQTVDDATGPQHRSSSNGVILRNFCDIVRSAPL